MDAFHSVEQTTLFTPRQVANKKQRDNAAADAELKQRKEEQASREQGNQGSKASDDAGPADILAAEEDEDVIF